MKNILLLTATLTPPTDAILLTRTDPNDRLNDYKKALRFYCSLPLKTVSAIVFAENSKGDLNQLEAIAARSIAPVEFLSFDGLDYPSKWGRAYGEFRLLDYAMAHSSTLRSMEDKDRLWKVTGRYRALNIASIVGRAPQFDLYCDIRSKPIPWADLRIFGCTTAGYSKLENICEIVKADQIGTSAETHLHQVFSAWAAQNSQTIVTQFNCEPIIDGIRGSDSRGYLSGLNLLKFLVRLVQRRAGLLH